MRWQVDSPPYAIANNNVRLPLSFRTVPATARHRDGTLHYNTHNVYGLTHAAATARALDALYQGEKRSFVLTRCAAVFSWRGCEPRGVVLPSNQLSCRWSFCGVVRLGGCALNPAE